MSDTNKPDDDPKIIVDEDWKEQVEADRERLRREEVAKKAAGPNTTAQKKQNTDDPRLPLASFAALVETLAAQAMAHMGQVVSPQETGEEKNDPRLHLAMARHLIDMLGMLEDKTRGNLTPEETQLLDAALHELRMAFVSIQAQTQNPSSSRTSNQGDIPGG